MTDCLAEVIGRHPIGLGAGPDRGGAQLNAAIATGFASIELGTITAQPEPDHNPGANALAVRLARFEHTSSCRIGVNIGSQFASPAQDIADDWLAAFSLLRGHTDYLTINLSAPYYAALLEAENRPTVLSAIATLARARDHGQTIPLLVKVPFGRHNIAISLEKLLPNLQSVGVNGLIVSTGMDSIDEAGNHIDHAKCFSCLPVIATGGIRSTSDVKDRLSAGAVGVQVYTVFAEDDRTAIEKLIAGR
jgi:dihydroorotate dehydrogenase